MCNQENPADEYYEDALDAADDINVTLSQLELVVTADKLCCNSANINSYQSVESINQNCEESTTVSFGGDLGRV